MNGKNILTKVEYFIPSVDNTGENTGLYVSIDFENGMISVEADYMLSPVRKNGKEQRHIRLDAALFYSHAVDLGVVQSGNTVFYLEGTVNDGRHEKKCSGLCVIDNNGAEKESWNVNLILSGKKLHDKEISFVVPVAASNVAA